MTYSGKTYQFRKAIHFIFLLSFLGEVPCSLLTPGWSVGTFCGPESGSAYEVHAVSTLAVLSPSNSIFFWYVCMLQIMLYS